MVYVEVVSDFFVEATRSHYVKGWKGEVSNELAARHTEKGTGFLKEIEPKPEQVPASKAAPKTKK